MQTKHPSYEDFLATGEGVGVSLDFLRLRWYLQSDDLSDAVKILQDARDVDSTQEPYSTKHPICKSAVTWPPVSSVTVSIGVLDDYEGSWVESHAPHADPGEEEYEARFDGEGRVNYCCGQDRPGAGPKVKVVANEPEGFVTIGQFIETVHPWLRELDGQIRAAKGVVSCWPLDPDVVLFVRPTRISPLWILDTEAWTSENWAYQWKGLAGIAVKVGERQMET